MIRIDSYLPEEKAEDNWGMKEKEIIDRLEQQLLELINSRTAYENLLVNTEFGVLNIDNEMRIRSITPVMSRNTNLMLADSGKFISEVSFMEGYPDFAEDVARCREQGVNIEREIEKDGATWLIRLYPNFVQSGDIDGVLVSLLDISKRLEAAKLELQALINNIPGAVVKLRYKDGLIVEYANDFMFNLIKMSREEFRQRYANHYEKFMYPEEWEKLKQLIDQGLKNGGRVSMEYRVYSVEGADQWRMIQASILEKRGNNPILQGVITDITMQKNVQTQLDSLLQHTIAGIIRINYNGRITKVEYISDRVSDIVGYPKGEVEQALLSQNPRNSAMFPDAMAEINKALQQLMAGNEQFTQEHQIVRSNQSIVWLEIRGAVVSRNRQGIVAQCIITDITKSKEAYLDISKEKEKLSAVVEMSGDMIFEYDLDKDCMSYMNPEAGILFPEQVTEEYARRIGENVIFEKKDDARHLAELLRSGQASFETELRRIGRDGEFHWVRVIGKTIFGRKHLPEKVLGKIQNIDEQRAKEEELREKSQKDSMTGLLNHMTAKRKIKERIQRLPAGKKAYLIICDIDNFKKINDLNGHLFGDAVICSFADEMCAILPDAIKGRIGGDEFIIFIEGAKQEKVEKQLVALNRSMTDRYNDDKMGMHISCSLGVAAIDDGTADFDILFQWADSALYKVKSGGKGSFLIVDVKKNMQMPVNSYLASSQNKADYVRKDTLIRSGEELALFCVELLENVSNVTSALRMISERTCRFYDLDDMVFVEHHGEENEILYQWSRTDKKEYTRRMYQKDIYSWDRFNEKSDSKGVIVYREEQTKYIETEEAKTIMIVLSKEVKGYQGSIVFDDRRKDRTWENERGILTRIANAVFNRIKSLRSEEKEQRELDLKLNYDSLTGLPIYNKFIAMVEAYLQKNGREHVFCVYSDFSNFQYLNEVYGYETGDIVLKEFSGMLMKNCKGSILFCRVTSDHFVGFIKGSNVEQVRQNYIEFSIDFSVQCNKKYDQCNLVIASGLYEIGPEDKSVAAMMDNANEARKKCKEQKVVTTVIVYNEEIKQQTESVREIVANVVNAYNNMEFQAYLQPKVSLKTGRIVGAEALVRWIRSDGRRIMPGEFIDICERNGFITKIDFYVLERVMEYLQEAIALGEEVVPVSVNFSRRHNEFTGFVPSIFKRLDKYQVPSSLLEAEVTESVFMADLETLNDNITRLRNRGIEVSVDDFGSGYSSLNILSRFQVDTIKLDRQFLCNTDEEKNSFTLVKYLIKMLKHLGFKVLAEGVETAQQVEMLQKADCDFVQGFYYAKPMPIVEFRQFLKEFNSRKE